MQFRDLGLGKQQLCGREERSSALLPVRAFPERERGRGGLLGWWGCAAPFDALMGQLWLGWPVDHWATFNTTNEEIGPTIYVYVYKLEIY